MAVIFPKSECGGGFIIKPPPLSIAGGAALAKT